MAMGLDIRLDDYQYELPEELIAQKPSPGRDESRLMVVDRRDNEIRHARFSSLPKQLPPECLLVINDARVVPVRLYGRRETGGRVEVFILKPPTAESGPGTYDLECLTRPARRLEPGSEIFFDQDLKAEIVGKAPSGRRIVRFEFNRSPVAVLEDKGRMPLPPYIKRKPGTRELDPDSSLDRERYQTVYARIAGAAAAPTAGLHFTEELLRELKQDGIDIKTLTLFVGYGTFAPLTDENIKSGKLHTERVVVPPDTANAVNQARKDGRPVVAVGTTVVRSLEYIGRNGGPIEPYDGNCDLFIYPGFEFKVIDHLVTNFHLPGSSLIMLVAALAGRERILNAYNSAVADKYRFFSYGDSMLIL